MPEKDSLLDDFTDEETIEIKGEVIDFVRRSIGNKNLGATVFWVSGVGERTVNQILDEIENRTELGYDLYESFEVAYEASKSGTPKEHRRLLINLLDLSKKRVFNYESVSLI